MQYPIIDIYEGVAAMACSATQHENTHRNFSDTVSPVSVDDFLAEDGARGKRIPIKKFEITVSYVKNVFCLGHIRQALFPKMHNGNLSHVFKESWDYEYLHRPQFLPEILEYLSSVEYIQLIDIDEALFVASPWYENFWHWFTEGFPKIVIMESIGYDGCYIVPYGHKHTEESLSMLNIDRSRVLYNNVNYFVKTMPILPQFCGAYVNSHILQAVRTVILDRCGVLPGEKRTYISRIGKRKLSNEYQLLDIINKYDFEVMVPENLPLLEQCKFMSNSIFSVMPHGANCVLTSFQKQRTPFLEVFPTKYVNICNISIIKTLNLKHHVVIDNINTNPCLVDAKYFMNNNEDYAINIPYVKTLLENYLR